MPASQEQKVDFLLKKIGYSASKTGIAEDESTISSSSNTAKAPFEEGIPSPLNIPQSSILADSGYIPTTPPGSDTPYVKGYRTATALRMTRDSTVGTNTRSYIAYTTYNDTSSARLTNWIDTQFGASYIIKVYKGDPNSGGVELQQAGANAGTDGWFFDYSSGILNFNGVNLPSGISATNIYIVGYRYIGAVGVRPPAGIGTFEHLHVAGVSTFMGSIDANSNLDVAGISTFQGLIDANGLIEGIAGQNKIPSLYANYSDLPNAGTYHGMFAHVHQHAKGYFAHGGNWMELVNKEVNGIVGTGTESYNIGSLNVIGITTLGNIGISTGRITGPAITYIDPATVGDDTGTLVVKGNLQVEGTQTTVNSSTMTVTDKNIELAKGAANDAAADGGGITIDSGGGDKTWQWLDSTDSWTSSEHIRIPNDKVFGFAGDTNTFISRPANDHLRFTTGGSQRLRIYGLGQVFVGDASDGPPSNAIFSIVQSSTTEFSDSTNVISHSNTAFAQIKNKSNTGTEAGLILHTGNAAAGAVAIYGKKTTDYNNDLIFRFRTGASTNAERVRITSAGQVAIGTTIVGYSSGDNLTIADSANCGITIRSGTSNGGNIYFSDGTSGADEYRGVVSYDHGGNFLRFYTNATEKVRIDSSGNTNIVGILTAQYLKVSSGSDANKQNVKIGWMQSENLSTGGYNVIVGRRAGEGINTGNNNVLIGANAGIALTTADDAVIIGANAGNNTTNGLNVYIGKNAAQQSTDSTQNVIIGTYAGIDNQGNYNTIVGYYAGRGASGATDGHSNTFIGHRVGFAIRGGDTNTGLGNDALMTLQNGNNNTALGDRAGEALLNGNSNVFIGKDTGKLVTNGSNDIVIGSGAQASSQTVSNEITLGNNAITKLRIPGIGVTFSDDIVILPAPIDASGDLTVGGNFKVVGVSTFSDDVTLTGASYSVLWDKSENALEFSDDARATFGDSKQLKIYRNSSGSTSTIENTQNILNISNTGTHTNIIANGNIYLKHGTNHAIVTRANAEVELYHNASEKLATTSTGINVTGLTETDTLTTGNATFTGTVSAGSTTGTNGYYLKTTGIGVTWAAFPSSRTGLTTSATAGQTSFNFSYNVGYVDVFLNGVKLPSSEFTASNGSTIILDDAAFANDTLEFVSYNTVPNSSAGAQNLTGLADVTITGTPVIGETLQHNGSQFVNDYTVTATTTSTSQTAILSLPVATYRSVEYTIQMTEGTKYHVTKVLAIHNGTNVYFNEYGTLFTNNSLSTFTLDVNSGNMRLLATPASTNSTAFKVKFTGIKV